MKKTVGLLVLGGCIVFLAYTLAYIFGDSLLGWWLANILHFSGWLYAVLFLRTLFNSTGKYHQTKTAWWMKLLIFIFGALVMGVLWEWYEFVFIYWNKIFVLHQEWAILAIYVDTMSDLFIDLLGAMAAGIYLSLHLWNRKNST